MKVEYRFTDLQKAYAWYMALGLDGTAAVMQTIVPCKSWIVVVYQ